MPAAETTARSRSTFQAPISGACCDCAERGLAAAPSSRSKYRIIGLPPKPQLRDGLHEGRLRGKRLTRADRHSRFPRQAGVCASEIPGFEEGGCGPIIVTE